MIQVLITGGNGYIARNLKPLLKKNGYRVISPSHDELDLLNREQLINYIHTNKSDWSNQSRGAVQIPFQSQNRRN